MSATGRGGERVEHDNYGTPAWCVHRLLERCSLPGGRWLEPCASEGAIVLATRAVRTDVDWEAIEIREACRPALALAAPGRFRIGSFLATRFKRGPGGRRPYRVILSNPPYNNAQRFVEKGLEVADHVALLLRANYLGSQGRAPFFHRHMPDTYILPDRPTFVVRMTWDTKLRRYRRTITDATEYAWLVWHADAPKRVGTVQVLDLTPDPVLEAARAMAPVVFG